MCSGHCHPRGVHDEPLSYKYVVLQLERAALNWKNSIATSSFSFRRDKAVTTESRSSAAASDLINLRDRLRSLKVLPLCHASEAPASGTFTSHFP